MADNSFSRFLQIFFSVLFLNLLFAYGVWGGNVDWFIRLLLFEALLIGICSMAGFMFSGLWTPPHDWNTLKAAIRQKESRRSLLMSFSGLAGIALVLVVLGSVISNSALRDSWLSTPNFWSLLGFFLLTAISTIGSVMKAPSAETVFSRTKLPIVKNILVVMGWFLLLMSFALLNVILHLGITTENQGAMFIVILLVAHFLVDLFVALYADPSLRPDAVSAPAQVK